jgi:hypothetical protein
LGKLQNVNTTDIADAIRLGCRTMCSVFNADDNDVPFFGSSVLPEACLAFSSAHSEAHVPGRHLNALLNAEDAVGVALSEECIQKHARAAFFSYSGPVALPLNRDRIGGPLHHFLPHNVREGFHALYALARFRGSERALELAEASINAIFELWDPARGWDIARLQGQMGLKLTDSTFIPGLARAIGPLVKLHRWTGCKRALELALVLKEKAVAEFYLDDGHYDRERFGTHSHSVTCVMSSLAQLADLTHDPGLMARVLAFYRNGLWGLRDELGWSLESTADDRNPDFGEVNNTGDILETALILGRWGYPEYYADAELILRGHLLPSQLRDISFVKDPPNPEGEDGKRDMAGRHLGAFGFPAPYGHRPLGAEWVGFNMDIVGGAVGSLCEAWRETVRSDEGAHWVNLLFDRETDGLAVRSPYTHGALQVKAKRAGALFVRLPGWVDRGLLVVRGTDESPRFTNGYLFLGRLLQAAWVTIQFPLAERQITLHHRTRDIRVRLRGDAVTAMDNFGADLTFFDPVA